MAVESTDALLAGRESLTEVVQLSQIHLPRPPRPQEFVKQMEEKFGRHWKNPGRPRQPAKPEKGQCRLPPFSGREKE